MSREWQRVLAWVAAGAALAWFEVMFVWIGVQTIRLWQAQRDRTRRSR